MFKPYVIFSCLLFVMAGVGFAQLPTDDEVQQRIDAYHAKGYPINYQQLAEMYKLPEGVQNAADIYIKAFGAYKKPSKELSIQVLDIFEQPYREIDKKIADEYRSHLNDNKKTLEFLSQAAGIPNCCYPYKFKPDELWTGSEYFDDMKCCMFLFAEQVVLQVQLYQGGQAVDIIGDMTAHANSVKDEPFLISQLVRTAMLHVCISSVEYVFNYSEMTDRQLEKISKALNKLDIKDSYKTGLLGESCFYLAVAANPHKYKYVGYKNVDENTAKKALKLTIPKYLDGMERLISIASLPLREKWIKSNELEAEMEQAMNEPSWQDFLYEEYLDTIPRANNIIQIDLRIHTELLCTQTAIAVERYRLSKGTLPTKLDRLVPEYLEAVPIDPYTGKPLKYKRNGDGFVVYSLFEDEKDQGGLKIYQRQEDQPHDVSFKIQR